MNGTLTKAPANEDWDLLLSFLPRNWQELASETGALKGLRKDKSPENLLRTLLLHVGCGHSLRETAVLARQAGLASLSDVALLKRLRKSRDWLYALCVELFREHGIAGGAEDGLQVRAFDATTVQEPGRTGSLWCLQYSVRLPSLRCDFFRVTATRGRGAGESFQAFPIRARDYVLAHSGFATAVGLQHVAGSGGYATVRVSPGALSLLTPQGQPWDLLEAVETLTRPGSAGEWPARSVARSGPVVRGRVCALRKTDEAIAIAQQSLRRTARRRGRKVRSATQRFTRYVILFSTFPPERFPATAVLEWYRLRWQLDRVLNRFRSLAQLGHLPKYDGDSAKAWLYGKLLVALLAKGMDRHAQSISPWGYPIGNPAHRQAVA